MITMAGCADQAGIHPLTHPMDVNRLAAGRDIGGAVASEVSRADNNAGWPATQWWQVYADPQLNKMVDRAIADNPTQAEAAARVREALSLAGVAHAGTLPSLNASASLSRRHWPESGYYSGGFGGQNTFDNTAGLSFDYPLDLFGAAHNTELQAVDGARSAAAQARAAQLTLEANVVRAYVQWSLQYDLLDIQNLTLADQQRVLDLAQRRFKAGIATQLEISEAEAPLPQTRLLIEQSQEAITLSRHQLAALVGKGPGYGDALARPSLSFDRPVQLPSALPAELIGRRPDVVALKWRVEAQDRAIDVARAAFYPNVNILATGGGQAVGAVFSTFTRLSSMASAFGPAVSLPIFEGGKLRSELGAAAARYDIAVAEYNTGVINALHEISDQAAALQSLRRQQDEAALSVSTAQRSYDIAVSGFKRGLTDYLNVLSAEDRLLHERQGVKQVQAANFAAYAGLMVALGGGVGTGDDTLSQSHTASLVQRAQTAQAAQIAQTTPAANADTSK